MTVTPSLDRGLEPARSESTLRDVAMRAVRRYLLDLNGTECNDLLGLMVRQVERPVLEEALRHCGGNLTRTAELLGMNRATLRKKLGEHGIEH
jgi:Fis family transcriptional regulator, factor for inversion stimulation protein